MQSQEKVPKVIAGEFLTVILPRYAATAEDLSDQLPNDTIEKITTVTDVIDDTAVHPGYYLRNTTSPSGKNRP